MKKRRENFNFKQHNNEIYIIAEMSGNHNQSFENAIEIAKSAKKSGASALKLQTYTPDTITIDCSDNDFQISEKNSIWSGYNLYKLYEKAYTDWEWVKKIFLFCKSIDLDCFSSVFDKSSIDFWEKLDPVAYKIASFENIHYPLIEYASQTRRPLIISTGLALEDEIDEIVNITKRNGCDDLTLLKCTSDYPANPIDSNLSSIPYLIKKYGCRVGLSDHTLGNEIALASVALGATMIEKHFTVSRDNHGVDSQFSANEKEFSSLVKQVSNVQKAIGRPFFGASLNEKKSLRFRRSIYAIKNIKKGDFFTEENIKVIRPGFGLHPKFYNKLLKSKCSRNLRKGSRLTLEDLNKK